MNKKLLLLLTMVFAMCCHHAYAEIRLASKQTGLIQDPGIKKGTVYYDAQNGILTLKDAVIESDIWLTDTKNITIDLIGENVIDVTSLKSTPWGAISSTSEGHHQITSSCGGSLKIVANNNWRGYQHSTDKPCSLTIKDCSVEMTAEENAFLGYHNGTYSATLDVTIDNASFSAHVTSKQSWATAVNGIKSLTLKGCEIVSPANYHFNDGNGYLYYNNESGKEYQWKGDVIVRPMVEKYGISIAGTQVDANNYNDILGDGTAKYDPDKKLLTLNNLHIDTDEYESIIAFTEPGNYGIELLGENTLAGGDYDMNPVDGIRAEESVHVALLGPGSLDIKTQYLAMYNGTLQIMQKANVKTYGLHLDGQIYVNDATLCIEEPTCIYGDIMSIEMIGTKILNEGVSFDTTTHQFVNESGEKYTDGPITIGPEVFTGTIQVILENCNGFKIAVIKVLREKLGLTLKEAKDLADAAPCVVIEDCTMEEANELAEALRAAGATVMVKTLSEKDITGVEGLTTTAQLPALYDLQGRQLRSSSTGRARGLYIVGGTKVLR